MIKGRLLTYPFKRKEESSCQEELKNGRGAAKGKARGRSMQEASFQVLPSRESKGDDTYKGKEKISNIEPGGRRKAKLRKKGKRVQLA